MGTKMLLLDQVYLRAEGKTLQIIRDIQTRNKPSGHVLRLMIKLVGYLEWLLWSWAQLFPQPMTRQTNRLQGTDISPTTAASPRAIPQGSLRAMISRFAAGPDNFPASEARKLPPNLISRFLPRFLIFHFIFFFSFHSWAHILVIDFFLEY